MTQIAKPANATAALEDRARWLVLGRQWGSVVDTPIAIVAQFPLVPET
jgi:hypothetical protein